MKAHDVDYTLLRELAELLKETGLSELEIQHDAWKVRVARQITNTITTTATAVGAAVANAETAPVAIAGTIVSSPMVGTVYTAPRPGAEPFVKIGDKVTKGQTLVIIEAMKVMNPIAAPIDGTVGTMLARDGQPVEFGETLLAIV